MYEKLMRLHRTVSRRPDRLSKFNTAIDAIEGLESRLLMASQPYTWQNAAIGGGGFVDGIVFSPTQPNVIYARTDIGGLFKYNAASNTWSELLDSVTAANSQQMGVLSVAIDPQNANNLYLDTGQYTGTDGWVLRSTDGGATFTSTRLSFYVGGNSDGRATGERLAVDPNDSSVLFLGSNNDGLWKSTDGAQSFSQVTSFPSAAGTAGITFVTYDPTGTTGSPSQTMFVGVNSTAAGSNLYQTSDGGNTWTEVSGTNAPTGLIPVHGEHASDGNWYFTYGNAVGPNSSPTTGAVYRYNPSTGVWTNISPVIPQAAGTYDTFGYEGLSVDPENPGTVVVTSLDRYAVGDTIWRTTNANAATPTWTALYSGTATRDTSPAPWISRFTDGIGNWAATVAIDPFNTNEVLYGDGQGLWETTNASASTVNFTFNDTGIEFTSALKVQATPSGSPLLSALGDINGFSHTTLTSSPSQGATVAGSSLGTDYSIDFAYSNPNKQVLVGAATHGGAYSTNDGISWTAFGAAPSGTVNKKTTAGTAGTVAMSASGSTIVWATSNVGVFYSTNSGSTWTLSGGSLPSGGQIVADRQNANDFYYVSGTKAYYSTNGGVSFTAGATGLVSGGNFEASPYTAGVLWLGTTSGLYESTNLGQTFSRIGASTVYVASEVAIGAPAPGSTIPAIYVWGNVSGVQDIFRSDDGGSTWTQINNAAQQFGGLIQTMAADPNVYGRVYIGVNGRGVLVGNPASLLPAGWSDTDVNTPGNPGFATDASPLSNGTTVNQWTVDGGGAGIGGTSDQFNFVASSTTGNGSISAQLLSLDNAGTGTPQAGVMYRASTSGSDVFAALVQTTTGQLVLESRASTGAAVTTTTLGALAIGSEYLRLQRIGQTFTAFDSSNGQTWTQVGSPITLSAMPATANAGLAVTASYNPQLSTASFNNVALVTTLGTTTTLINNGPATTNATQALSLTATVTGGVPDGETIALKDAGNNNAVIATAILTGGTATFALPAGTLLAGTHPLFATYAGDTSFAPSQSLTSTVTEQVVVTNFALNGNIPGLAGVQRSMIDSAIYTFSEPVNAGANAFNIALDAGQTGTLPTLTWTAVNPASDGSSAQWAITFGGNGVVAGSIADGVYDLTMNAAAISSDSAPAVKSQARAADTFARLFGDSDGDGSVSIIDFNAFAQIFGFSSTTPGYNGAFDSDGDNSISIVDFNAFASRFGETIYKPVVVNTITPTSKPATATITPAAKSTAKKKAATPKKKTTLIISKSAQIKTSSKAH